MFVLNLLCTNAKNWSRGDDHIRHLYRVTPPHCNWRLQCTETQSFYVIVCVTAWVLFSLSRAEGEEAGEQAGEQADDED